MSAIVRNFAVAFCAVLIGVTVSGCGSDTESSDAGPVDAGEAQCQDACKDFLDINHIVEHVTGQDP